MHFPVIFIYNLDRFPNLNKKKLHPLHPRSSSQSMTLSAKGVTKRVKNNGSTKNLEKHSKKTTF